MPGSTPKRKELTLREKVQLICRSEGKSHRTLAQEFKIGRTQVGCILKRKAELLKAYEKEANPDRKRQFQNSAYTQIDTVVFEWYSKMQSLNIPASGPMIQTKALNIAKALNQPEFKASGGWLSRFKSRHIKRKGIPFPVAPPEADSYDGPMEDEHNISLAELLCQTTFAPNLPEPVLAEEYTAIDDSCPAHNTLDDGWESHLIQEATTAPSKPEPASDDEAKPASNHGAEPASNHKAEPVPPKQLTDGEAQDMLNALRVHFLQKNYSQTLELLMATHQQFQDEKFTKCTSQPSWTTFTDMCKTNVK